MQVERGREKQKEILIRNLQTEDKCGTHERHFGDSIVGSTRGEVPPIYWRLRWVWWTAIRVTVSGENISTPGKFFFYFSVC